MTEVSEWVKDDSGYARWGLMGATDSSFENGGGPNPDVTNGQQGFRFNGGQYISLTNINTNLLTYDTPFQDAFSIMAWIRHDGTTGCLFSTNDAAGTNRLLLKFNSA